MNDEEKRRRLLQFLDKKAFEPILRRSADDYPGEKKKRFEDVKRSTESERERFHRKYRSAAEVKENYLSDLNSKTAKKKNAELEDLGLPRLPEFREEFLDLCNELQV